MINTNVYVGVYIYICTDDQFYVLKKFLNNRYCSAYNGRAINEDKFFQFITLTKVYVYLNFDSFHNVGRLN